MSDSAPKKPIKPNSPGTGTVFDVKRPGKAPIQATSRPIIVGHKPMVRDPFTTGKPASDGPLLQPKQKAPIQAASAPKPVPAEKQEIPTPSDASAASPELAAVAAELAATPEPKEVPKENTATETVKPTPEATDEDLSWKDEKSSDSTDVPKDFIPGAGGPVLPPEPAVKKQAPLSPALKKEMEAAAHETIPAPEPDGVVVSGDHGPLSIGKILLWFAAVIVLVAVVGDVLLDAGTITTSVSIPHTNLIK